MAETAPTESVINETNSAPVSDPTPAADPSTAPAADSGAGAPSTTPTSPEPGGSQPTQPTADLSAGELNRLRQENAALQDQVNNYQPLATLGNQYLYEQMHGPSAGQQQPQQQPQPGQPAPEQPWWSEYYTPAEYNTVWDHFMGDSGNINANAPPQIQEAYVHYNNQLRDNLHKLGQNPAQFLEPMIDEAVRRAEERARAVYGQESQNQQNNQFVQNLEAQNADWLYARNHDGSWVTDGHGQKVPSNLGQRANQLIQQVGAPTQQGGWGIQEPQARWQAAMTLLQQEVQSQMSAQPYVDPGQQPAQPQTEVDAADQKRQELLDSRRRQASNAKSRNGVRETASQTAPTNRVKSDIRETFRQQLEADGLLGQSYS